MRFVEQNGTVRNHFVGVKMAHDHGSETQLEGWHTTMKEMEELQREIYGPDPENRMDARDLAIKAVGSNSDHSEDQKKLWRLFEA